VSTSPPIGPLHVFAALAPEPADEVWYLASDEPYGCAALALYRCRFQIETSFRDDKSGGWDWEASPLRDPDEVDRFCLVMAVATLYTAPVVIPLHAEVLRSAARRTRRYRAAPA